jgi:hypothetical protein
VRCKGILRTIFTNWATYPQGMAAIADGVQSGMQAAELILSL